MAFMERLAHPDFNTRFPFFKDVFVYFLDFWIKKIYIMIFKGITVDVDKSLKSAEIYDP